MDLAYFLAQLVEQCAPVQAMDLSLLLYFQLPQKCFLPHDLEVMLELGWEQGRRPVSKPLADLYQRKHV